MNKGDWTMLISGSAIQIICFLKRKSEKIAKIRTENGLAASARTAILHSEKNAISAIQQKLKVIKLLLRGNSLSTENLCKKELTNFD